MKKPPELLILLIVTLALTSCSKLRGEFGFRYAEDKGYKRNMTRYEFDASKEVQWIYQFGSVGSRASIGVILLKKEIGWVDIVTSQDYVDEVKHIVYGTLKELEPGDYKLVLTEVTQSGNRQIDECEFYLYSDAEPLEEPFDE